jgi:DNA topoisomerase-3
VIAATEGDKAEEGALPPITPGEPATVRDTQLQHKHTTPPPRYTEGTLIAAMKNVARDLTDPTLKQVLKETAGIGTEATRAGIIKTLFDRQFLEKEGKKALKSTPTGRALIASLPGPVKEPSTTALWEQALEHIAQGQAELTPFLDKQAGWIRTILAQMMANAPAVPTPAIAASSDTRSCPDCGKPMRLRQSKTGAFYGCSGYPACKKTLPTDAGTSPDKTASRPRSRATVAVTKSGEPCPKCQAGQVVTRTLKNGANAGKPFQGCTGYPRCDYFAWPPPASGGW